MIRCLQSMLDKKTLVACVLGMLAGFVHVMWRTNWLHQAKATFIQQPLPNTPHAPPVVYASGASLRQHIDALTYLKHSRGQLAYIPFQQPNHAPHTHILHASGIYSVADPTQQKITIGATRHFEDNDNGLRQSDHDHLLARFNATTNDLQLPNAAIHPSGRVGTRVHEPKTNMPIIGQFGHVYAIGALGARGVTSSLLAAECLACHLFGDALPIEKIFRHMATPLMLDVSAV